MLPLQRKKVVGSNSRPWGAFCVGVCVFSLCDRPTLPNCRSAFSRCAGEALTGKVLQNKKQKTNWTKKELWILMGGIKLLTGIDLKQNKQTKKTTPLVAKWTSPFGWQQLDSWSFYDRGSCGTVPYQETSPFITFAWTRPGSWAELSKGILHRSEGATSARNTRKRKLQHRAAGEDKKGFVSRFNVKLSRYFVKNHHEVKLSHYFVKPSRKNVIVSCFNVKVYT